MALIRYMEINTEATDLTLIPIRNGQIIFCKDTLNVYLDNTTSRINMDIIVRVTILPTESIDLNKLYYNTTDTKIYRYYNEKFNEVNVTTEIYDIIATNEDIIGCYLTKNGINMAPCTYSELVNRPDGETVEESMINHEKEISAILNPYIRHIEVTEAGKTTFIIPLPNKHFFLESNSISIYKNDILLGINEYTLNVTNSTFTLAIPVIISDKLDVVFHYIKTNTTINRCRWITTVKDEIQFTITNFDYMPGSGSTSLYLNGIKQPLSSYIELDSTHIQLKASIPIGTIVDFEAGKFIPFDNFFDSFINKTVTTIDANTEEIVFDNDNYGRTRKIVNIYANSILTTSIGYIDNIEVIRQDIVHSNNVTTYTVTKK